MNSMHRSRPAAWAFALAAILIVFTGSLAARADEADDAYRRARRDLNRELYSRAVEDFARFRDNYPDSHYVPDALYWEAFSRARIGASEDLERALVLLNEDLARFPAAEVVADARELALRIETQLAKSGDAGAAYRVTRDAERLAGQLARSNRVRAFAISGDGDEPADPDEELRITALNALMQMDSERALPTLQRVLGSPDKSSPELRARAVFILAQHGGPEVPTLLVKTLKEDPDPDVRQTAVFWLGQAGGPEAMRALKDVIGDRGAPEEMREQALFAISQQGGADAIVILRKVAEDKNEDTETRQRAIFWIGQSGGEVGVKTLRELYRSLDDREAKEQALFALSQTSGGKDMLLEVARNKQEDIELRSRALFWAGQMGEVPVDDIVKVYRDADQREMKEQVIFTLSQQRSSAAVEKLMEVFREEKDPELRTRIVFWIGQSKHPKAAEFLEEILNK